MKTITKTTKKKNEAAAAKGQRALRAKHVSYVCAEIETHRGSNGRIPRGVMSKVFEEHKQIYPWMTINLIKKGLMKSKLNETPPINDSSISDLTMPTFADDINQLTNNDPAQPPPLNIGINQGPQLPQETSKAKGGRPRGTTLKALREKEAKRELLINDIASSWSEKVEQERKAGEKKRMKRNELDELIKQKTESSGLTDVKINKKSIQQRVFRKRVLVARHPGTASPLKPIEEYIISMLNEMAKMRQPLCVSEGLALAN